MGKSALTENNQQLTDKSYLMIAIPFMLSTMTQPLLGAVDTAVMGRIGVADYIAAVSVGALLFNNLYWVFGFLRVSTSGYSAQALEDRKAQQIAFWRPVIVAVLLGLTLAALQQPLVNCYLGLVNTEPHVAELARQYFKILIWGAPFVLLNYVIIGWLMGRLKMWAVLFTQISGNLLNIVLDIVLGLWLELDITGVAAATLFSQLYTTAVGLYLMHKHGAVFTSDVDWRHLVALRDFGQMMLVNVNLMLRTICLLTVNNMFTIVSASMGTNTLAANAVLLQLLLIISYLIDGLANAVSIFSGKALARQSISELKHVMRLGLKWAWLFGIFISGLYFVSRFSLIGLFTDIPEVVELAGEYSRFVAIYTLASMTGLLLFGIYSGATYTAPIRDMMFIAAIEFILLVNVMKNSWGNDGLWTAYVLFKLTESIVLVCFLPRLRKKFKTSCD